MCSTESNQDSSDESTDDYTLDKTTDAPPRSGNVGETASRSDDTDETQSPEEDADETQSPEKESRRGFGLGALTRGPRSVPDIDSADTFGSEYSGTRDLRDEELAASIRALSATVSDLGNDMAATLEQNGTDAVDTRAMLTGLVELSNLLLKVADTVDRTHE